MTTLFYSHPVFLEHDTSAGHPESPARLSAILEALERIPSEGLERREAPEISREALARVHSLAHIERVLGAIPSRGHAALDPDTIISPRSGEAALRAAGAVVAAVDAVMAGEAQNGFCAVRPPGHHAEPERAMGFCLFNNVAVGARHLFAAHGLERLAIIDFDVHHGNGTQAAFWSEPRVFYGSTHQSPLYPGSGAREERGVGNIVNCPLAPGSGGLEFRAAMENDILPALDAFAPDFVLVSAGFDAHRDDPLASLAFTERDYAWITDELVRASARHCQDRLVSVLEGGYNLRALAASCTAHLEALLRA